MADMPSPEELVTQSEYYLHALDLAGGQCEFLKLDKQVYKRSPFMDERARPDTQESVRASLAVMGKLAAERSLSRGQAPINYIFHTAFCCSTLISKCLDIEGRCYVLREPLVLLQLANHMRAGYPHVHDASQREVLLNTTLFLLAKSAGANEVTLIKPTNAANNLAFELIRQARTHSVVLLYSSLEQFLVSIIKKGEEGRAFVRKLFNIIRMDSERTRKLEPESVSQLTDLQIAAFVWYVQMDAYLRLLDSFPNIRIRTLDCEIFLAQPLETLEKLCRFLDIEVDIKVLEAVIAGPIMRKKSKNGIQDYDAAIRKTENSRVAEQHRATLNGLIAWSARIRPEGPIVLPLPKAL